MSAPTPERAEPDGGATTAPEPPSLLVGQHARGLAVATLLVAGVSMVLVSTFGYGRDQGIYAVVARSVLEGGMPYREAWDFKPPGIYLIYALSRALLGPGQWGIRLFEVAGLGAMVLGLVLLAKRWWGEGRIGLLAAAMATLVHAQLDFWHTAQPESFGGMLTVWGLVVGTRDGPPRRRVWRWVGAGLLFGCAGLLKPPLAGGGAVLALFAAVEVGWPHSDARDGSPRAAWLNRLRGISLRQALLPIGAVLLGGVVPFALCLAWFWARGALGPLHDTLLVFTPHYTALGWEERSFLAMLYQAFAQWLVSYSSLLAVGLLALLAAGRTFWRRRGVALLLSVIAMQLVGVALQGKYFPYHYAAVWPVTALLAALGWWSLWQRAARRGRLAVAGFAIAILLVGLLRTATKDLAESFWWRSSERLALLLGSIDQERIDALASVADVDAHANRRVAELLRRHVPVGRGVFVWGFEPVIYDFAERPAVSRFIYNVPQRVDWASEWSRAELMDAIRRGRPAAIVVAHNDLLPMVTGDYIDSAHALEGFGPLATFIYEGYEFLARIDDLDVYLERQN